MEPSNSKAADQRYQAVHASYFRCEDSVDFFDSFYEIFFAKSPKIPPKFANTDMEMQKQIIGASVVWMLRFGRGDPVARREIEKIGESHSRSGHDIMPELYPIWLDALCDSVREHDPQFTNELESQWRKVIQPGIDLIKSFY